MTHRAGIIPAEFTDHLKSYDLIPTHEVMSLSASDCGHDGVKL